MGLISAQNWALLKTVSNFVTAERDRGTSQYNKYFHVFVSGSSKTYAMRIGLKKLQAIFLRAAREYQ